MYRLRVKITLIMYAKRNGLKKKICSSFYLYIVVAQKNIETFPENK